MELEIFPGSSLKITLKTEKKKQTLLANSVLHGGFVKTSNGTWTRTSVPLYTLNVIQTCTASTLMMFNED